ncbi:beta-caryophyllene synthase, partial [Tanacetum coccineum]
VASSGGMERGFLSQKGSGGGRGVKEKDLNRNKKNTPSGIGVTTESNDTMNDDTPIGVASAIQEGVTQFVVDMTAGNAPGKSSYANITGKPSAKKVNVRTLFTPRGNGIDVVVPVDSIRAVSARFANTAYGFFLGKKMAYPVVANYVRNTWGKYGLVRSMFSSSTGLFSFQFSSMDGLDAMLENGSWFIRNNPLILKKWHPDANLLKDDVSTVSVWVKLHGVPVTAFSEDGLSSIAPKLVMIEIRADVELKDNIVVAMPKITREGHYTCNVRVEPNASSSGNKKKGVEPTIEVSNLNPFDALNLVDNDVELGTNGGTTNLVNNGATSSGSSFMYIDNDVKFASNTLIGEKSNKIERQICEGKLRLLDNDGNPPVPTGIVESDSEFEVVFDETANLRILTSGKDGSDKGYGTNSLLEQWRDSYPDNDDYDPYDDDMYENHDLSEHLQSICDDLDITLDNDGNSLVPTGIVESDSEVEVVFDETANLRISTWLR